MIKIKAIIYAALGFMMCWSTYKQGNYLMMLGIACFVGAAIFFTLSSFGKTQITWDDDGVILKKFPGKRLDIPWDAMTKLKVDHLGYHVTSKYSNFRIGQNRMPKDLLLQIRKSIAANKAPTE